MISPSAKPPGSGVASGPGSARCPHLGAQLGGERFERGKHLHLVDSDLQHPGVITEGEPEEGAAASLDSHHLVEGPAFEVLGKLKPDRVGTAIQADHALCDPGVAGALFTHVRLIEGAHWEL